jgi:hypothetical protein
MMRFLKLGYGGKRTQQRTPPTSGGTPVAILERPTLNELDAFYRNPSSLEPDRLAVVAEFVKRERIEGSARENYLKRRAEIEAAIAARRTR